MPVRHSNLILLPSTKHPFILTRIGRSHPKALHPLSYLLSLGFFIVCKSVRWWTLIRGKLNLVHQEILSIMNRQVSCYRLLLFVQLRSYNLTESYLFKAHLRYLVIMLEFQYIRLLAMVLIQFFKWFSYNYCHSMSNQFKFYFGIPLINARYLPCFWQEDKKSWVSWIV